MSHEAVGGLTSVSKSATRTRGAAAAWGAAQSANTIPSRTIRPIFKTGSVYSGEAAAPRRRRPNTVPKTLLTLVLLFLAPPAGAQAATATMTTRDLPLHGGRTLASAQPRFDMVALHWRGR